MKLNTNTQALASANALWFRNNALQKASTNLSIGTKINKSGDDPSGMAISNKMRMQIKGLDIAGQNTTDAISLVQVAEGGLIEMSAITQRVRELSVNAANGTLSKEDRQTIQTEINQLMEEIDDISNKIEFNQKPLLNDDYKDFIFQIGGSEGQEIHLDLKKIDSITLGVHTSHLGPNKEELIKHTKVGPEGQVLEHTVAADGTITYTKTANGDYQLAGQGAQPNTVPANAVREPDPARDPNDAIYAMNGTNYRTAVPDPNANPPAQQGIRDINPQNIIRALNVTEQDGAVRAIDLCDKALADISEYRSKLGSTQNRLDSNNNSLILSEENTKLSLSRIMDTDMAEEMSEYTKNNVLVQSGIAMLAQANQRPNQLLSLLQ